MNQDRLKDTAYAIAKGAVGMIPLAGAPASELLSLLVASPLERRRERWMTDVGERLHKLEQEGKVNLEELRDNDLFLDIVLQATQHALRTSDEEKRGHFKNVIENTAIGEAPEKAIAQVYLNLLDRYTVWHVRMLKLFDDPEEWLRSHSIPKPTATMGSLFHVFHTAFPELSNQRAFCDLIWAELERDGMHKSGALETMISGGGMFASRTTEFGRGFLHFIAVR